jgi:hypothetical protein
MFVAIIQLSSAFLDLLTELDQRNPQCNLLKFSLQNEAKMEKYGENNSS